MVTSSAISIDEQVDILMRGTRFADEADWDNTALGGQTLRRQMASELLKKLKKGKPLRVYLGVDPTGSNLHVGHFVPFQKLKKFQDLGHHVIFLIGDYTAMIGDPSGRIEGREKLTHDQVLEMAKTYQDQAFRILDPTLTEVRYNSEWLSRLDFAKIIELAAIFPLKQIISRRDFQNRMEQGESLRFHEALYSLMQGYDAYALNCDVQVGAYDQHFNLLSGRAIQEHLGQTPHVMITNPLLIGTDGRKMSKSYGNTINIRDEPFDMFGKTMRIADQYVRDYLELTSTYSASEIDGLMKSIEDGANPMEVKKVLAHHLVTIYHGEEAAGKAEQEFFTVVQKKEVPDEVAEVVVPDTMIGGTWIDLIASLSFLKSKGEARRLIQQGGFYLDQQQMTDQTTPVSIPAEGIIIRLGKRTYYRLIRQ